MMANQYAISPQRIAGGGLLLYVEGIDNFVDYANLVASLEAIEAVDYANIEYLHAGKLLIRLLADGTAQQLRLAIAMATRLQPLATFELDRAPDVESVSLAYRWPQPREQDNDN